MQPVQFKIPNAPKSSILRINNYAGVNYTNDIKENEAADILNFELDEAGNLRKRAGFKRCFDSLGKGKINGMTIYRCSDGTKEFIFCQGTKLYKMNKLETPIESEFKKQLPYYDKLLKEDKNEYEAILIYDGLADDKVSFFIAKGKLYIQDGEHYLMYDGTNVSNVEDTAYIPLISVSNNPTGGGTTLEDFNLLTRGFRISFSGDGENRVFQLPKLTIGNDKIEIKYADEKGEHTYIEGDSNNKFTVDRETNKVTFSDIPVKGTNNIEVKAYLKDDRSYLIKSMRFNTLYGGRNDTRVFVWGDQENPNLIRFTGITDIGLDVSYFPENSFIEVGSDNEAVMNIVKQYQTAVIIKEWSIWDMNYEGQGMFPIRPINDTTGCIAGASVQLLRNSPVMLDRNGLFMLTQSNVRDERNVSNVSINVNSKLLKEVNIKNAVSIDYDNKYFLSINDNVYIFDYLKKAWFVWDNIKPSCFLEYNRELYFGSMEEGIIYKFRNEKDKFRYVDDYKAIRAYWKSNEVVFGNYERNKIVKKMFISIRPAKKTSCSLFYVSNDSIKNISKDNLCSYSNFNYIKSLYLTEFFNERAEYLATFRGDLFSFRSLSYLNFSYSADIFPKELVNKVKVKKYYIFNLYCRMTDLMKV